MEAVEKTKKPFGQKMTFLSGFWIKVLALLTMTIDHVGVMIGEYYSCGTLYEIMRIIGRFALPLFCFSIVEGVIHTHHFGKYALRLGIVALMIMTAIICCMYVPFLQGSGIERDGNIFLDLLLGAVMVYLLRRKKPWLKLLAVLPFAYGIISYLADLGKVSFVPYFLRTQYGFYGILLILGFYCAYLLSDLFLSLRETQAGLAPGSLKGTYVERITNNILAVFMLAVVAGLYYLHCYYYAEDSIWMIQNYAVFAGAFLLFYSGKRGYNAKWFEIGCYAYYPSHLLIIYGIFELIAML